MRSTSSDAIDALDELNEFDLSDHAGENGIHPPTGKPVIGKCSSCRQKVVLVAAGRNGKFCRTCYDRKLECWKKAFGGYDLKQVPLELHDDGEDAPGCNR